jgi:hypothetical protein
MTFITQGIFDIGKIQNDDIAAGSAQRSAEWEKKTGKLQKFFGEALYDKNLFIDEVRHTYRENYASETAGRILNWAIGQKTGMTTDQIKIASRYGEGLLDSLAAKHGIKVTRDHKTNSLILMTDDTVYQVNVPGEADRLPQGSNGVENFKPFVAPSDHEIGLIHDHIMPAIKYMHDVAVRYGPDMVARTVTMDKLYDLMKPERTLSLSKIWSGITRGLSALKGIKKQKTPVAHASF